jgi:glycosyltransferase 2 family protein
VDDGVVQTTLTGVRARNIARIAGTVLCAVALAFFAQRGLTLRGQLAGRLASIGTGNLACAVAAYAAGSLLLGVAWVLLVRGSSGTRLRAAPLFRAHLQSQLAKYVPGNIFHFAYRHVAAREEGVGHRALGLALVLESVGLIASASAFGLALAWDPRIQAIAPRAALLVWLAPFLPLFAWLLLGWMASRKGLPHLSIGRSWSMLGPVLVLDLFFFIFAAVALQWLAPNSEMLPLSAWCSWLSLAWLLGYVVPGAPAGLGLRELVLVQGLGPLVGQVDALAIAVAYRMVTGLADALLAAIGFGLRTIDRRGLS